MQDGIANQPPWPLFPLASSSTLACVCSTVSMNGKHSSPAPGVVAENTTDGTEARAARCGRRKETAREQPDLSCRASRRRPGHSFLLRFRLDGPGVRVILRLGSAGHGLLRGIRQGSAFQPCNSTDFRRWVSALMRLPRKTVFLRTALSILVGQKPSLLPAECPAERREFRRKATRETRTWPSVQ